MKIARAACLTLDKRYEDFLKLQEKGKEHGFDIDCFLAGDGETLDIPYDHVDTNEFPPQYNESTSYGTWWARPNAYNAWKTHRKILWEYEHAENLLMFEDDSVFESDFSEVCSKVEPFFEENYWDMIYFGSYQNNTTQPTKNEYVYRTSGCAGFHAVLMKNHIVRKLLQFPPIGPYDWIAGKYLHQSNQCFAIIPCIVSQKDGHSYVEGGHLSKPDRSSK